MYDYESCENLTVTVASSHELPIFGYGKLLISTVGDNGQQTFTVDKIAHVPGLDVDLFFYSECSGRAGLSCSHQQGGIHHNST